MDDRSPCDYITQNVLKAHWLHKLLPLLSMDLWEQDFSGFTSKNGAHQYSIIDAWMNEKTWKGYTTSFISRYIYNKIFIFVFDYVSLKSTLFWPIVLIIIVTVTQPKRDCF